MNMFNNIVAFKGQINSKLGKTTVANMRLLSNDFVVLTYSAQKGQSIFKDGDIFSTIFCLKKKEHTTSTFAVSDSETYT